MAGKKNAMPADEQKIADRIKVLAAIDKPTDAQTKDLKERKAELGALRFVRLANKRVPKATAAIENIGKLSGKGYAHTQEQRDYILKALRDHVTSIESQLAGTKSTGASFALPK